MLTHFGKTLFGPLIACGHPVFDGASALAFSQMGRFYGKDGMDEHFAHTTPNHTASISLLMDGQMTGRFLGQILEVARSCGTAIPDILPRGNWVMLAKGHWEQVFPPALPWVLYGGENNTKNGIKLVFDSQGTAATLAIEDMLDKDSSEDDLPTAGATTERPGVVKLSKNCGYPRPSPLVILSEHKVRIVVATISLKRPSGNSRKIVNFGTQLVTLALLAT